MEPKSKGSIWIYLLILALIVGWFKFNQLKKENVRLTDEVYNYAAALDEANSNIEEANSVIEDAQSHVWSSYEEMGDVLESLYTVDTVPSPAMRITLPSLRLPALPSIPSLPVLPKL